ncbi:hypothetical protein Hanom_Chr11g01012211 [Helianthus anomalus]
MMITPKLYIDMCCEKQGLYRKTYILTTARLFYYKIAKCWQCPKAQVKTNLA